MSAEQIFYGICKQVNHGDNIVIRERSKNGPPATLNLSLMNVICPKMNFSKTKTSEVLYDELFAWEAREFVRTKIIGKDICYTKNKMPKGGFVGEIYLGKTPVGDSINLELVREGLAEVRKVNNPEMLGKNPNYQAFVDAENIAKEAKKGKWDPDSQVKARAFVNSLGEESQKFLEKNLNKFQTGIVEYVRDGASMQVCLIPENSEEPHSMIMVSLAGIRCPGFKLENDEMTPEKFAVEAKTFVELRMLQRPIKVKLFALNNNQSFIGSLIHPNGDIAVFLLKEGLAKVIEWSLKYIENRSEYSQAELMAKSKRMCLWVDFVPPPGPSQEQINLLKQKTASTGQKLAGTLIEVGLVDNVTILCADNVCRKIFLSSIRVPRPTGQSDTKENQRRSIFESQFTFAGREFLRKFVGKKVQCFIDYTLPKPADSNLDDRLCGSVIVMENNTNLSEGLVSRGLAMVVKHRANDPRSKYYDALQLAEAEAIKKSVGLHSKEAPSALRVNEVTGNPKKSKEFLPLFQRQGRVSAIVEYIPSASRLRLYCPKESVIITLVCAGVICARNDRRLPNGKIEKGDAFGEEAFKFVRDNLLQRNVEFEVEAVDKTGGFIGYVHMPQSFCSSGPVGKQQIGKMKSNPGQMVVSDLLNVVLVMNGFGYVNRNSAPSSHGSVLDRAEVEAKKNKRGVWSLEGFDKEISEASGFGNDVECEEIKKENPVMKTEGKSSSKDLMEAYKKLVAQKQSTSKAINIIAIATDSTTGSDGIRVMLQYCTDSVKLASITKELAFAPPTPSQCQTFKPTKGTICACLYEDNYWYRCMITNVGKDTYSVTFIDFGNEEVVSASANKVGPIPDKLKTIPGMAKWVRIAGVKLCDDSLVRSEVVDYIMDKTQVHVDPESLTPVPTNKNDRKPLPTFYLRYKNANVPGKSTDSNELVDLAEELIKNGFVYVDPSKGSLPHPIRFVYEKLQSEAMLNRTRIWKYGDCRPSD